MQFTQEEVLTLLKESSRTGWTVRQMTTLREEGYLPPLKRLTKPGTNKPLYVWEEEDMKQICDVYDWWNYYDGDRATLTMILWLQKYDVPIERLRRLYLNVIEKWFEQLTRGERRLDNILHEVSSVVFVFVRKFQYSPGFTSQRKKFSAKQMESVVETILSALAATPNPKLVDKATQSFRQSADATEEDLIDAFNKLFNTPEYIAAILRDILALPKLHEVVQKATIEQWEEARDDYMSLCQRIGELGEATSGSDLSLPDWFIHNLTMQGACFLIVPLLSTRYRGYHQWVDLALKKMHDVFTDPSFATQMSEIRQAREPKKGETNY